VVAPAGDARRCYHAMRDMRYNGNTSTAAAYMMRRLFIDGAVRRRCMPGEEDGTIMTHHGRCREETRYRHQTRRRGSTIMRAVPAGEMPPEMREQRPVGCLRQPSPQRVLGEEGVSRTKALRCCSAGHSTSQWLRIRSVTGRNEHSVRYARLLYGVVRRNAKCTRINNNNNKYNIYV